MNINISLSEPFKGKFCTDKEHLEKTYLQLSKTIVKKKSFTDKLIYWFIGSCDKSNNNLTK